jgi:hypothetical protein
VLKLPIEFFKPRMNIVLRYDDQRTCWIHSCNVSFLIQTLDSNVLIPQVRSNRIQSLLDLIARTLKNQRQQPHLTRCQPIDRARWIQSSALQIRTESPSDKHIFFEITFFKHGTQSSKSYSRLYALSSCGYNVGCIPVSVDDLRNLGSCPIIDEYLVIIREHE